MEDDPLGAGGRSFNLIDVRKFLGLIDLREGMTVVDLACGYGHYSFELSKGVGAEGVVYAVDLWKMAIEAVEARIEERGIKNIRPVLADISRRIPLEDGSVDLCLMAAVLHDLLRENAHEGALREARRMIKGGGTLAVVEFKVIDGPPGPPKNIRIDPERTGEIVAPFGFSLDSTADLGPYAYTSIYRKRGG